MSLSDMNVLSNETYLITGGAGFIGSHLANELAKAGERVWAYDNLFAGKREFLVPAVNLVVGDILDNALLNETLRRAQANRVIHLAAIHFIPYCNAHPEETLHTNVEGTLSVLRACAETGVSRVVVASSGALYRDNVNPICEDDPIQTNDVYGLSKWMTEACAEFFARQHGLNIVAARLFNTFGPHETQDHLIPAIVRQLKNSTRLTLGNLESKRDYIYVEDTARALRACADIREQGYTVVNVGTGVEYSAREIVELAAQILNKRIEIVVAPELLRQSDKLHQFASFARLQQLTGWTPRVSFENGLRALFKREGLT